MAKYTAPRLKAWAEMGVYGVPCCFMEEGEDVNIASERWSECVANMAASLQMFADDDWPEFNTPEWELYEKVSKTSESIGRIYGTEI